MPITREQWLSDAAVWAASEIFARPSLAEGIKISCGWPSKGGLSKKKRTVGQCWDITCSAGNIHEIFVSPYLHEPLEVLTTVVHEMVHADVGVDKKHGKVFGARCREVGLAPPWTVTPATAPLLEKFANYLVGREVYPHKLLDSKAGQKDKEPTISYKAVCPQCEYTFRLAKKWADLGPPPQCVCGGHFKLESNAPVVLEGMPDE